MSSIFQEILLVACIDARLESLNSTVVLGVAIIINAPVVSLIVQLIYVCSPSAKGCELLGHSPVAGVLEYGIPHRVVVASHACRIANVKEAKDRVR